MIEQMHKPEGYHPLGILTKNSDIMWYVIYRNNEGVENHLGICCGYEERVAVNIAKAMDAFWCEFGILGKEEPTDLLAYYRLSDNANPPVIFKKDGGNVLAFCRGRPQDGEMAVMAMNWYHQERDEHFLQRVD